MASSFLQFFFLRGADISFRWKPRQRNLDPHGSMNIPHLRRAAHRRRIPTSRRLLDPAHQFREGDAQRIVERTISTPTVIMASSFSNCGRLIDRPLITVSCTRAFSQTQSPCQQFRRRPWRRGRHRYITSRLSRSPENERYLPRWLRENPCCHRDSAQHHQNCAPRPRPARHQCSQKRDCGNLH